MTNILENSTGTTGGGRSSGRARYYNTHQACTVRVIAHRSLASSRLQTIQKERPLLGPESVAGDPQQISGVTVWSKPLLLSAGNIYIFRRFIMRRRTCIFVSRDSFRDAFLVL